jgi:Holliday junction resolvase
MAINTTRKGSKFETEIQKTVAKTGWHIRKQPSSGAFGSRVGSMSLTGDLVLSLGDYTYRAECKRRAKPPLTLMGWLAGCHILFIRADHGEPTVFMTEELFLDLLTLAAEGLAKRGHG